MEWTFHHLVGTAGHPGEVDKPNDFAFRRVAPAPDQPRCICAPSVVITWHTDDQRPKLSAAGLHAEGLSDGLDVESVTD